MEIELSSYLKGDNCAEGDIVEFLDEGVLGEMKQMDGSVKKVYNFQVRVGLRELTFTPSVQVLKAFCEKWGRDSKAWIGKKWAIRLPMQVIKGKEQAVVRPNFIEQKI